MSLPVPVSPEGQPLDQRKPLTPKQRRFVEEFCVDFNATQAAIRAGYSARSAGKIGHENRTKPEIVEAIAARLDQMGMTAGEATKRLTDWGRGTFAPFLERDANGRLLMELRRDVPEEDAHLIKKMEVTTREIEQEDGPVIIERKVKLELHDAKDAVVQMAKVRGLLRGEMEDGAREGIAIEVYPGGAAAVQINTGKASSNGGDEPGA